MKIFLTEEAWGKLSAEMKAEYTKQTDGRYLLKADPEAGWALEDVTGLRTALEKERLNVSERETRLSAFKDLDAVAARKAIADLEELRKADPTAKNAAAIKALEEQLTTKFAAEKDTLTKELQSTESALAKALIDSVASQEFAKPDVGGSAVLLMPHIRNSAKVVKLPSGERVVRILQPDGTERISRKPGVNTPMDVAEFVHEMRNDPNFAMAFKAPDAAGSGAKGTSAGSGGNGNYTISSTDARDPQKYQTVHKAASAAGQTVQVVD